MVLVYGFYAEIWLRTSYRLVTFMLFVGGAGLDIVLFASAGTGAWLEVASMIMMSKSESAFEAEVSIDSWGISHCKKMLDSKLGDEMQEVAIQEDVISSVGGRGGRVELCLSRSKIQCLELASGGHGG